MQVDRVYHGTIVHCTSIEDNGFHFLEDHLLGVSSDGTILFCCPNTEKDEQMKKYGFTEDKVQHLEKKFLMPGMIDTHIHAPQYSFAGTGNDLPLLQWLERYTFPTESKFAQKSFATNVFTKAVRRTLGYGTTTACYFSTIHLEASKELVDILVREGQRAYVGKVCMDRNSPENYIETTQDSLQHTEEFVKYTLDANKNKNALVTPVITPRFVPTCSSELMKGLSKIANSYDIPIQSHISENKGEVEWVKQLHPELSSYSEVYDHHGLFNHKTIMAHGIYLSDDELKLCKERGVGIAHCPLSNFNLHSGILDVRRVLKAGVKIGLGTDVSGGYSPSILDVIRTTIIASNTLQFSDDTYKPLSYKEAFALATIGGAQVLGLEKKIGNFEPGKAFDALIVDPYAAESPFDVFENDSTLDVFQKFIFMGNNKNIEAVFVNGKQVLQ